MILFLLFHSVILKNNIAVNKIIFAVLTLQIVTLWVINNKLVDVQKQVAFCWVIYFIIMLQSVKCSTINEGTKVIFNWL